MCRIKKDEWIVPIEPDIILITSREYGYSFKVYWESVRKKFNCSNSSNICTSEPFDFVAFYRYLHALEEILVLYLTTSETLNCNRKVSLEYLKSQCTVLSLMGIISIYQAWSEWLLILVEFFSYNLKLHAIEAMWVVKWLRLLTIKLPVEMWLYFSGCTHQPRIISGANILYLIQLSINIYWVYG